MRGLEWAGVAQVTLGKFDLIVSRTGYTGERQGYELLRSSRPSYRALPSVA
ncbi:MAG UNVERIFIED_CONTAM: hypothetical protein LVT10_04745 [Anaerolineae bacterium]